MRPGHTGAACPADRRCRRRSARHELPLELGDLLRIVSRWSPQLPSDPIDRYLVDTDNRTIRLGDRARIWFPRRRLAHSPPPLACVAFQRLRRAVPQHSAAGSDVSLVLCPTGTGAEDRGHLAQADAKCVVLYRGCLPRPLYGCACGRTAKSRNSKPAQWTALG